MIPYWKLAKMMMTTSTKRNSLDEDFGKDRILFMVDPELVTHMC